ncbi:uncharacterized protein [Chamaea fasciata]|uniref:uncharacterized protein n=1 Tax=Chamaea fasciata TaxID=190680 RepID=UPI00336A749B
MGAGSLFTLTVERGLEGGRRQRSALRILVSPGATGPCPRLECRKPSAVCLPWIVERLLEGNSLTFLLLCVSLPDTSREEILGALGLAERVKGVAKTISATLWDPEEEILARRREIRGLRMELLAGSGLPEQRTAVAQMQRALRELQVLKNQRWEKKQAVAKVLGTSEMHQPSAEDQVSAGNAVPGQQPGTQTPLTSASLEPAEPGRGARHASHSWVKDTWAQSTALRARWSDSTSQGGDSRALASAGQGLLEEPSQSKVSQPRPACDSWDTERWQQEVTTLGLSLEAALREREAAEGDLEALRHRHQQEMQACRQHLLQVLRDQQRLAEEQRAALERRHRALLQELLRDAVELAENNQRLRDSRRAGTADASTQSP